MKSLSHSLKAVAERELGFELDKTEQGSDWSDVLTSEMLAYAGADATVLLPLSDRLLANIEEADLSRIYGLERRATLAVSWMQNSGLPFDAERWREHIERTEDELRDRELTLAKIAPQPSPNDRWNWRSHLQVKRVFNELGIDLPDTKEVTLAGINHPLARELLAYRKAYKMVSGFGPNLLERVHDGRIYASWRNIGAATGRMSCKEPNLQQLPKGDIRGCVCAPEGRMIVSSDYSQIELRLAARIADDVRMQRAYANGQDLHCLTATSIFDKSEVTKEERDLAKAVNFGLLYGQGAEGLRIYVQNSCAVTLTLSEAHHYRNRFFETYSGLASWHERERRKLSPGRLTETRTLFGRRRFVRNFRERVNSPVQGSGADGLKLALALLFERQAECTDAFPVSVVHDEIVIECSESDVEVAVTWLEGAMKDAMDEVLNAGGPTFSIPVDVDTEVGAFWMS